jgi:hypothetical protein
VEGRLLNSVRYLASDELEGRGIGTRGIELAAQFIAQEFARAGLQTKHNAGSPYQRFARRSQLAITGPNELRLRNPRGVEQAWTLGQQYTPLSLSGTATLELPIVFAGYGITAEELGYDDYRDLAVAGRAVLILRHAPRQEDRDSPFGGTQITEHTYLHRKVANAVEHGAAAVLFCTDQHTLDRRASEAGPVSSADADQSTRNTDFLLGFRVSGTVPGRPVPVIHLQRQVVAAMIAEATGQSLAVLEQRIDASLQPQSRPLEGWSLLGQVSVGQISKDLKNVVATLEGSGPSAEETIVIGAHYDHLGYGGWGSLSFGSRAVHNGADDNASGTAVVMELARQLAGRSEPLGRRLLFIAFTAEESGLVGSENYVGQPLVPLEQTVAMLNFDMVGYLRNDRLQVHGTATAREFDPLLYRWGTAHDLRLIKHASGNGPSDHAPFYQHGVPVLHFFTGFHDHYHRPSDDWDRLNIRGMRRITDLARDLVVELANRGQRPRPLTSREDSLYAELSPSRDRHVNAEPINWGIELRRVDGEAGLVIERIAEWGLADRFGFRPGDRILAIGSRQLSSSDDYAQAVANLGGAGDVSVVFERAGLELEVQVVNN